MTGYRAFETRFRRRVYRPLPEEVRFAVDSLLEGDGFEPLVPRQKDVWKPSFSLGSARVFSREE